MEYIASQNLLPYQFEPEFTEEELEEIQRRDALDDRKDQQGKKVGEEENRIGNTLWCACENCTAIPTVKECLSCDEESAKLLEKLDEDFIECAIEHPDFRSVCLTKAVLEMFMICLHDVRGYGEWMQWDNRTYRLIAYRAYTIWVHHKLGRGNRRVIPSCVVREIRRQFPSPDGTYQGYKDVEDAWTYNFVKK